MKITLTLTLTALTIELASAIEVNIVYSAAIKF